MSVLQEFHALEDDLLQLDGQNPALKVYPGQYVDAYIHLKRMGLVFDIHYPSNSSPVNLLAQLVQEIPQRLQQKHYELPSNPTPSSSTTSHVLPHHQPWVLMKVKRTNAIHSFEPHPSATVAKFNTKEFMSLNKKFSNPMPDASTSPPPLIVLSKELYPFLTN